MRIFIYSVNNWGFESKLQNFLNSITVNLKLRLTNLSNATIWHAPLETDHCKASTFRINLHKIIYSLNQPHHQRARLAKTHDLIIRPVFSLVWATK